jgi:hypothetical protein
MELEDGIGLYTTNEKSAIVCLGERILGEKCAWEGLCLGESVF